MEIDAEFEPLTVYSYEVSPDMDKLIRYVFEVIPEEYSEDFPSFSVFETPTFTDGYVEHNSPEDDINVFLDPKLLKNPRKVAIGTLAHEFAHVYLRHIGSGDRLKEEHAADRLACQWGFKEEIAAMRESSGPPTLLGIQ